MHCCWLTFSYSLINIVLKPAVHKVLYVLPISLSYSCPYCTAQLKMDPGLAFHLHLEKETVTEPNGGKNVNLPAHCCGPTSALQNIGTEDNECKIKSACFVLPACHTGLNKRFWNWTWWMGCGLQRAHRLASDRRSEDTVSLTDATAGAQICSGTHPSFAFSKVQFHCI